MSASDLSGHWADQHLKPVVRRFLTRLMVWPNVHSCEHAVALQIDDLLGLRDRKGDRVIAVLMRVCPNESVLFRAVGEVLLDDSRGLIVPLRSVRGRPDAVALVFDPRRVRLVKLAGRSPTGYAGPRSFNFRKHGPRPSLGVDRRLPCRPATTN